MVVTVGEAQEHEHATDGKSGAFHGDEQEHTRPTRSDASPFRREPERRPRSSSDGPHVVDHRGQVEAVRK
jgi:hypothetical protein